MAQKENKKEEESKSLYGDKRLEKRGFSWKTRLDKKGQ